MDFSTTDVRPDTDLWIQNIWVSSHYRMILHVEASGDSRGWSSSVMYVGSTLNRTMKTTTTFVRDNSEGEPQDQESHRRYRMIGLNLEIWQPIIIQQGGSWRQLTAAQRKTINGLVRSFSLLSHQQAQQTTFLMLRCGPYRVVRRLGVMQCHAMRY